jgi:hypothetical protein
MAVMRVANLNLSLRLRRHLVPEASVWKDMMSIGRGTFG